MKEKKGENHEKTDIQIDRQGDSDGKRREGHGGGKKKRRTKI